MSIMQADDKLIRMGIVYDGNFFLHVSNYYLYHHERNARISLDGLHAFVRSKVAEFAGTEARYCPIVDAHYFRGRLPSKIVEERNRLLSERVFEDILIRQNITTHYLPVSGAAEKGIDVWLALETYELAVLKRFNVIVLIAGDGDFVPLVRKLNALGTRVMLLGWDFRYQDESGEERETRTSQALQAECTYPLLMSSLIDTADPDDTLINNLFVPAPAFPREARDSARPASPAPARSPGAPAFGAGGGSVSQPLDDDDSVYEGNIKRIKEGYGFITAPQLEGDIFFYHLDVLNGEFNALAEGDLVEFKLGKNEKGITAREITRRDD
ncbi:MAG TPA: NYN domain-containing protein [Fibrobacteria bacterium]|nr:NYN domain-containing protein [Fibrobacteria bacterium]